MLLSVAYTTLNTLFAVLLYWDNINTDDNHSGGSWRSINLGFSARL